MLFATAASVLLAGSVAIGEVRYETDFEKQRFDRRAIEAALWGMPAVNYWAMREGFTLRSWPSSNF